MDSDIALWVIQYLHQHHPQALSALFERALNDYSEAITPRDTERALRVLLETGRANGYIFDDEWAALGQRNA